MAAMEAILDFQLERFYLFLIYKSSRWFLPSFKPIGISVKEKKRNIDFQEGRHGVHLGFLIWTILASSDLQVTPKIYTRQNIKQIAS